ARVLPCDRILCGQRVTLEAATMREPRVLDLEAELARPDLREPILEALAVPVRERQVVRIRADLVALPPEVGRCDARLRGGRRSRLRVRSRRDEERSRSCSNANHRLQSGMRLGLPGGSAPSARARK